LLPTELDPCVEPEVGFPQPSKKVVANKQRSITSILLDHRECMPALVDLADASPPDVDRDGSKTGAIKYPSAMRPPRQEPSLAQQRIDSLTNLLSGASLPCAQ
jgi:hypothetical protein